MLTSYDSFEHWSLFEALIALEETGVFHYLREHGSVSIAKLAHETSVDELLLRELCSFIVSGYTDVLQLEEDDVCPGSSLTDPIFINHVNFATAYKNEMHTLFERMKGTVQPSGTSSMYGHFLGSSSEIYSQKFSSPIVESVRSSEDLPQAFIDLGCGAGTLLETIRDQTDVSYLFGVDQNPGGHSRNNIDEQKEKDITFIHADIQDVSAWSAQVKAAISKNNEDGFQNITISMVTVLHEFTKTEHMFRSFIEELKAAFPGAQLVIAEQLFFSMETLKLLPYNIQIPVHFYQLIHHITGQGMPQTHARWQELFKNAELRVASTTFTDRISAVYRLYSDI